MFLDTWSALGRVALVGTIAFVVVVVLLRLSGKRTLAKMNAFDLVVTVALGSAGRSCSGWSGSSSARW